MIEISKQRLNPRYYASGNGATVGSNFKYCIDSDRKDDKMAFEIILKWVMRVQGVIRKFELHRCNGVISAIVVSNFVGFGTKGHLTVFDDHTYEAIRPTIVEFFQVLNEKPSRVGSYNARFFATIKIKKFYLQAEGAEVTFKELDTEARRKAVRIEEVTIPSPSVN